jgi:ribosomal protein S18 acetylase RimI-like enzyme
MTFNFFQEAYFSALYQSFIEAFSSYKVPFKPSFEAFQIRMMKKLALNHTLSALALQDSRCVGFVLHTLGVYEGKLTIYNGGTGVIPSLRGKHLTSQLYDFLASDISKTKAERIVLEVISSNDPAIHVYKTLGFQYRKTFRCYRRKNTSPMEQRATGLNIRKIKTPDFESYRSFADFEPSFIDNSQHLMHNINNEITLEAEMDGKVVGYAIFQPHLGRISQLGVHSDARGLGIASNLLNQIQYLSPGKELSLINVPESYQPMQGFLLSAGFKNEVDQFEMELVF